MAAALALPAIVGALIYWKDEGGVPDDAKSRETAADQTGTPLVKPPNSMRDAPSPVATGMSAEARGTQIQLVAALASDNPYEEARRLREAGAPGTFAAAHYIASQCIYSLPAAKRLLSIGGVPVPAYGARVANAVESMPSEVQAQRVQAAQALVARCQPFLDDTAFRNPLSNDESGKEFLDAIQKLKGAPLAAGPAELGARYALTSQGMALHEANWQFILAMASFEGRSYADQRQIFGDALTLANAELVMNKGNKTLSIHSLMICVTDGACAVSNDPEKLLDAISKQTNQEQRVKTVELARRMKSAVLAHNLDAFLIPVNKN